MLFERVPLRFRDGSLPEGVAVAGPSIEIVRAHPRYVERAHRQGHPVHVWTVDAAADIDLCLELGSRRSSPTGPAGCSGPSAAEPAARRPPADRCGVVPALFRPGCGRARAAGQERSPQLTEDMSMADGMPAPARRRTPATVPAVGVPGVPHERTGVRLARHAFADQLDRRRGAPTRPATTRCWCSPSW